MKLEFACLQIMFNVFWQTLHYHIAFCTTAEFVIYNLFIFQNLGRFGPLKCREIYSLDKLNRQADIVENLLHVTTDYHHDMQKCKLQYK